MLIELSQKISLLEFVKIKHELEDALGKKVDLVKYQAVKPGLKDRSMSEEVRVLKDRIQEMRRDLAQD